MRWRQGRYTGMDVHTGCARVGGLRALSDGGLFGKSQLCATYALVSDVDQGIMAILEGSSRDPFIEEPLRQRVAELQRLGCRYIAKKLFEFKAARRGHRFGDLLAELRLAHAVSRQLGCPVDFQNGDAADIRFIVDGVDCLLCTAPAEA